MQTEQKKINIDSVPLKKSKPISDLAGSWKMNDEEANKLLAMIKHGWNSR